MESAVASQQPFSARHLGAVLVCAAAGFALFQFLGSSTRGYIDTASLFYWWGRQWFIVGSEAEHGPLILGLSGWLFWRNLRKPETGDRIPETTAPSGLSGFRFPVSGLGAPLAAMLAGLALHAVGFAAQQARISIVALLVFSWGVLRLAGGPRWGRAAVFPLAFLVFAIPVNLLNDVGFWLRMWVIDVSAPIARSVGIGVLQTGTQLLAPDGRYNYDVAAACSGIRSLTAMVALSLLAGYLNFHSPARRTVVLLLCLPLVYLGNVVRILAIILAAHLGGQARGEQAHEVMGFGVFLIVLGGVLLGISLIRRWWPEPISDFGLPTADSVQPETGNRIPKSPPADPQFAIRNPKFVVLVPVIVVAAAAGEMLFLRHLQSLPSRGAVGVQLAADGVNPVELPAFLGTEWIGRRAEVTAIEREILPADTGFSRKHYIPLANPRQQVFLSIVLSGRDRTSIHRPELCVVGDGWTINDAFRHRFGFPGEPRGGFEATLLRVRRETVTPRGKVVARQLVAYWFVGADRVVATHWERLGRDAWNRVFRARADRWAYVLMQTDASDDEAAALARMQAVLNDTLPRFQKVFASQKP